MKCIKARATILMTLSGNRALTKMGPRTKRGPGKDYVVWLKKHSWRIGKLPDEDSLYAVRYGNIWLGSRRNA
jgi:hypothetical protein